MSRTTIRTARALASLCLALLAAHSVSAAEITLVTSQDATLFGGDGGLSGVDFTNHANGAGYTLFAGTNATGSARRALLQFDFSALPAGAVITAAQLSMTLDRVPNGNNQLLSLHVVTSPWTTGTSNSDVVGTSGQGTAAAPGDATWFFSSWPSPANPAGRRWQTAGGDFLPAAVASSFVGPLGPNQAPLTYTWSDPGMVYSINAWLANPASNFGWVLTGNEGQTQSVKRFISREALDSYGAPLNAELLPHLVLTYSVGSGPGTTGGGVGPVTPGQPSGPWGAMRRRANTPRPAPCCQ